MENRAQEVALTALETLEMRSLAWGFVDQALEEEEAEQAITAGLEAAGLRYSASDVLDTLVDGRMVRVLHDSGTRHYRTRIAEITRLFAHLRQWFGGQPWQAAPRLVSDFRIDIRPRRYPRRHLTAAVAWESLNPERRHSAFQHSIWAALAGGPPERALADFQVDAARRLLTAERGTGTIVTAGTGSGKTLAFYLPALLRVAPEVRRGEWWTKVVCLYPRQELLKDQFSEAYGLAMRASEVLMRDGHRLIAFGSFFGPTPFASTVEALENGGWRDRPDGHICPFLRCTSCGSEMIWTAADLREQHEVLRCVRTECGAQTLEGTLRLTRRSVQSQPPDFLFSTTEMMNQRLSDTRSRHIFGVGLGSSKAPLLTLLDEAHTYSGVSGAQTALLLRRWSTLLGSKMRWVGLSATLPNAAQFFADLTGTWADNVAVIAPTPHEMVAEGAEYQIILRGDPASQTSTLSTSIQALMLLARMLDTQAERQSGGRFGTKAFAFTDDLDVTHRLFDNLLDAEAYTAWRRPDVNRTPLAALRASAAPEAIAREREGQRWQMAEDLWGLLGDRLTVGRTTSRDPGVESAANVIVATSSLEVGFNDPDVGAVFQHKAPRSAASFLQRRGRAGRTRDMRPLTVLVLSDYGRDRAAFQSYEQSFDPVVEIAPLPIRNLYVLRMQAVYATLDWIAKQAPDDTSGWSWAALAGPDGNRKFPKFQDHARDVLRRLLQFDTATVQELKTFLQSALAIDRLALEAILWHPPRSLFLEVLPTLARRLFRQWMLASRQGLDLHKDSPPHPLPDFIPANLFSDLNLPEVQMVLPAPGADREGMPVVSALQQFAPGRVRRRFADAPGNVSHWVPLDTRSTVQALRVCEYAPLNEFLGSFNGVVGGVAAPVAVYRPWEIPVTVVPRSVSNTSNSQWHWQSDFHLLGQGIAIELPMVARLSTSISRLETRLHRFGAGVAVRRFAHDGKASLRVNHQEQFIDYRLVDETGAPAAIGFAFEADALLADIRVPSSDELGALRMEPELVRWLRYLSLKQKSETTDSLPASTNVFLRDWLHQAILLAAVVQAEQQGVPLQRALQRLREQEDPTVFGEYIGALVAGTFVSDSDDGDGGSGVMGSAPTPLETRLSMCLTEPGVLVSLLDLALGWSEPVVEDWSAWLSEVAISTVAEAMYLACVTAAPQNAAAEGITVDVVARGRAADRRVIVAETTLGGGGTLEALSEVFAAEPRAFVRALESACAPTDHELAAEGLRRVVGTAVQDPAVAASLAELRAADNTNSREIARRALFRLLSERGIPVSRTLSVMLATRLVRPGADANSDELTLELIRAWQGLEAKHGIAFPLRVAIPAVIFTTPLGQRLVELGGRGREILTAHLLLWPCAGELRQRALQSYNPYRAEPYVDASLGRLLLFDGRLPVVQFGAPDWIGEATELLAKHGVVRISVARSDRSLKVSLLRILSTPVVSGFLQFYPMVEAIRAIDDDQVAVDLLLRERV
jgi:hypothetical protein